MEIVIYSLKYLKEEPKKPNIHKIFLIQNIQVTNTDFRPRKHWIPSTLFPPYLNNKECLLEGRFLLVVKII